MSPSPHDARHDARSSGPSRVPAALLLLALAPACAAPDGAAREQPPIGGLEPADHLIEPGERHFARLWRITRGFENAAEGYFSFSGERLVFQAEPEGSECDQIFVTDGRGGFRMLSSGKGKTTCAYFLPTDREVVYASTHLTSSDCPPKPDWSKGYVWKVHPEFDLVVHELESGRERRLTDEWGYDAEATVSPRGDRLVFTSTRSGDLELWTMALDGTDLVQVTDEIGYDGGAFFSHDGEWLVYRRTRFTAGKEAEEEARYRELLLDWSVRPHAMDVWMIRTDGTDARRVTDLGGASFAPYFFPGDRRIVFASNHHDRRDPPREFDLFAIDVDGKNLEQLTRFEGFDSFPMFSPDGRWLVFASNRGATKPGETSLFLARWRD